MSQRLIILIAIVVGGVLLIVGILYFVFRPGSAPLPPQTQAPAEQASNANLPEPGSVVAPPESAIQTPTNQKEQQLREEIKRLGIMFTERFGSYSNQSNFANITDLQPVMTESMKNWSLIYIDRLKTSFTGQGYKGVTTRVIASSLTIFEPDSGRIEVALTTQREELNGSTANSTVYYQGMKLVFIQENKLWKVDGAFWEQK